MLDAVFGTVIMVLSATALVLAVEVVEISIKDAGRQPLSSYERELLQLAGRGDENSLGLLQADLEGLPRESKP